MNSNLPILYSFRRCPYAMRARLALWQSGVLVQLREVVLRNKPAELLAISPKGTVPVLQLVDGTVIEQSLDIMQWALAQSDRSDWHPTELANQLNDLIARHDIEFKPLLDAYKYPERHLELSPVAHQAKAMYWLEANINIRLEQYTHLIDNKMRLADAAIAPFIRQFAAVDHAWFKCNAPQGLQVWLTQFKESDLLASVMEKYPPWQSDATPCYFGQQNSAL